MDTYSNEAFLTQIHTGNDIVLPYQALHLLQSFLGRSRQLEDDLCAELHRLGIELPQGHYQVAIFEIDERGFTNEQPLERHRQRIFSYAKLRQDLTEAFRGKIEGFLFLSMGYLVGILFSESTQELKTLCQSVLSHWQANSIERFSVTLSRRHTALSQVTMAYEEATNRQHSRLFFGSHPTLLDGESIAVNRTYLWSSRFAEVDAKLQQAAQRICGAALAGQTESAHQHLQEALALILEEGANSTHYVELQMMSALFSARLSSALREAGVLQPTYEATHSMSAALLDCHTELEFNRTAHDCLDGYLLHHQKQQDERCSRLSSSLRDILSENATNPQIGLGMAARHFSTHPATLATNFRKAYGESVGDFINRIRVQIAKSLLQNGNVSVQEVSEQVGFCSGTTMYRAFLRYEGRPPKSFKGRP